jgi:hypothetical protein
MLQLVVAFPCMALATITVEVKNEVGCKEMELLGQSSAARNAVVFTI